MKSKALVLLPILVLCLFNLGCAPRGSDSSNLTYIIEGAYLNNPQSTTLLICNPDGFVQGYTFGGYGSHITYKDDVAPGNSMWARVIHYESGGGERIEDVEIHVHSFDEIMGGEWNHGKFGRDKVHKIR